MGSYLEVDGMEQIRKKLEELGKKGQKIENKALSVGAEIVRQKISEEAPRSDQPRQPSWEGKGTQKWRTGLHASDHITASNVKKVNGMKVVEVGIAKDDNSEYFYLKFHEYGTEKMPPRPFMERALRLSQDKAREAIKNELKRGLGL